MVGPEKPLVDGIVDFSGHRNKIFGPNKLTSQLEGLKLLQKNYVNIIYLPQNLKFLTIKKMLWNIY